ncbi:MAG: hypothetical protein A2750_02440 [Candidatus Yanofskybacteria bacterium RIFCSPHIGHO2_01_FULL_45_42]|uniref:Uncharacterized protein n=2 Tax=Candidatus Yanofskyibacteriota TaxID=1752733 RepID=A0A1F8F0T5_9BACT|nr:MAG: hypothetical protein A2750_02440 [Candidatus Yanofskybacteria bacterium RIFCSPHIGHO2_01_FULL_45_42]OGN16288.1 MAG: hypothetical protein A3C81_00790 [Candidatus Yanofskybacteria bacterium RIFCSPHIGHO2_02_FULL_46_19]
MSCQINPDKFEIWLLMEYAGFLHGKKRRLFIEELKKKYWSRGIQAHRETMLMNAETSYPQDRQARRKHLKELLKHWEKTKPLSA